MPLEPHEQQSVTAAGLAIGPWKARLVSYLDTWFIGPEGGGESVCLVNRTNAVTTQNPDGSWTSRKVPVENADAVAHLIEAAPDLLAALREVEAHHVEQNRLKGRDETRSNTLRIVRAAIAKALPPILNPSL